MSKIYLASKSPRRRELLNQIGIDHEVLEVEIEELWNGSESAYDYVSRLALEKAMAGKAIAKESWPVLASDTEVILNNVILGKPKDKEHAIEILMSLSGRQHDVFSAVALIDKDEQVLVSKSQVYFKTLTVQECEVYCETGEPFDKAGGYGIQGKAAAFIERIEGSYSGIMGLPLYETSKLLVSTLS